MMSIIFQQQFYGELLRSEKRRTLILIAIFLFGMLTQLTNMIIGSENHNYNNDVLSFRATWVFPVFIVFFELLYLIYLNLKLKRASKQIPLWVRYFIVAAEIFLLGIIMIAV